MTAADARKHHSRWLFLGHFAQHPDPLRGCVDAVIEALSFAEVGGQPGDIATLAQLAERLIEQINERK